MNFTKRGMLAALFLSTLALGGTRALACPPTLTPATGGSAISAGTAGGAWTTLTGPILAEGIAGEVGTGTIVLKAPAGFVFNSGAAVTVKVTGSTTASKNLNNVSNGSKIAASVTSTTITISITARSAGSVSNSLTWQNIQVRPTASTPLASGNMNLGGTADIYELACDANAGTLREVAGGLAGYKITGSSTGTAGTPITITVQKVDQYGNPLSDGADMTLTLSGLGNGTAASPLVNSPTGTFGTGLPVVFNNNGTATITFTPYTAETGTVNVTDGAISSTPPSGNGLPITINPAPASKLVFTSAPTGLPYGSAFSASVQTVDQFGNPSTGGLGSLLNVTLLQSSGAGTLSGTLTANIGTGGGNGAITFSGLHITAAGNSHVVQALATGLTQASTTMNVAPLTVTPSVTVSGKAYDGTTGAAISTRSLSGVVGGDDATLGTSGSASFADKHVGNGKPVNVTGLALSGAAAGNYQLSTTSCSATANITPRVVTVTAAPVSKVYDGTSVSAVPPSIGVGSVAAGDSATFTQAFSDKNVGTSKLVTPSGTINDGNGGANYTLSFVNGNVGTITARAITVTSTADSKIYDGSTSSTAIPSVTSGGLIAGDSAGFTQTFADKNVGTGKSLIPAGTIIDGNGGNNYSVTMASVNTGVITARTLTVRADDQTQHYGSGCPTFTTSCMGFVAGENMATCGVTGSPNLSCAATSDSLPGTYTISAAPGTLTAPNYNFNFIDGTLTIVPAINTNPGDISDGLTVWIVNQNGTNYLAMKFKRNHNAAALGLQYLPEVSSDKQAWLSDVSNLVETSVLPLDSQFDWVTVQDQTPITPTAPRFIQLKVLAN